MKKFVVAFVTLALISTSLVSEAQTLSKQERKVLKKEIKTYKKDPAKWVRMLKRHETQVTELTDEVARLKAELAAEKEKSAELQAKLDVMMNKYTELQNSMPKTDLPKGTVYQVQMGYFQYLDLMSFNNKLKTVKAEDIGGAKRYVIGYFEDVMDAVQFSNDIKTLGVSDAFVSQYIDGERVMDFDALKLIGQ